MTDATKKSARRKKRTSKHVLKANEEREKQKTTTDAEPVVIAAPDGAAAKPQTTPKPKKKKTKKHIKDPSEAVAYLSSWKHRDAGGGWKFNKNTQSWLIRHMYEPEKVSKAVFADLMEYLGGLQGSTRIRVMEDATRRALRYKEHEKSGTTTTGSEENKAADNANDGTTARDELTSVKAAEEFSEESDEQRWKRLNDHDKRKEYKRARVVLETLKE